MTTYERVGHWARMGVQVGISVLCAVIGAWVYAQTALARVETQARANTSSIVRVEGDVKHRLDRLEDKIDTLIFETRKSNGDH